MGIRICDRCGSNSGYVTEVVHRFGKKRHVHHIHPHCDPEWYKHIWCSAPCYLFNENKATFVKRLELPAEPLERTLTDLMNFSTLFPEGCRDFLPDDRDDSSPRSKIRTSTDTMNFEFDARGCADFVSDMRDFPEIEEYV